MFSLWPTIEKFREMDLASHEQLKSEARKRPEFAAVHAQEVPTIIGKFGIGATAFGVKAVFLPGFEDDDAVESMHRFPLAWASWGQRRALEAGMELMGYLLGEIQALESPVDLSFLTPFQRDVFEAVRTIPWGARIAHAELAELSGHPGKALAVGGALRNNPAPIFVPCHRVVPESGGIGSWCGPTELKAWLLGHETLGCA